MSVCKSCSRLQLSQSKVLYEDKSKLNAQNYNYNYNKFRDYLNKITEYITKK